MGWFTVLVECISVYNLFILGSIIAAFSLIPLAISSSPISIILFVFGVSIAESVWGPRLSMYVTIIAP